MDVDFSSQAGFQPPSAASVTDLCGFLVPGGPLRTDFVPADNVGTKRTLQMNCPGDLPSPLASVRELVCFLAPNCSLPPNHGVQIFWSISGVPDPNQPAAQPPSTGFELLGSLTPDKPSEVFQTGWSEHEQLLEILSSNIPVIVTFGLSVEPLNNIANVQGKDRVENRMVVAQKIAGDLFRFMQSFDTGGATGQGQMVVPANIFDRWMQRFETRFRRDPNFFLKEGHDN
jgi:hypothetical protein